MTEKQAHTLVNEYFQAVIAGNGMMEGDPGFVEAAFNMSVAYRNLVDTLKTAPKAVYFDLEK